MAFPQIETGYKPEFGLGAVYQGFNAANADQSAEMQLIKQFLDNQRNQNEQPIDLATKQQNFNINNFKTDPRYQNSMLDQTEGQGMTMLAAGQTARGLQPFKQNAEQLQFENEAGLQRNQAQIQAIDDALNEPEARFDGTTKQQLLNTRANLVNRFKETPAFAGKRELRETGTDSAEYIAELRAQQAAEVARLRAVGEKEAKTAEETMQRIIAKQRRGEKLTPEDIAGYNTAKGIFDAKNEAKRQQGLILDPALTGGALQPKDPQLRAPDLQVSQPTTSQQGGGDLQAAILAEIKRRSQQGK